jgi:hypothetical protein
VPNIPIRITMNGGYYAFFNCFAEFGLASSSLNFVSAVKVLNYVSMKKGMNIGFNEPFKYIPIGTAVLNAFHHHISL